MTADNDTNYVYFSSLIRERAELHSFWRSLEKTISKAGIRYSFISNTNDLWCRDYMPVQVSKDKFVQFTFNPSYYNIRKYRHLLTETEKISVDVPYGPVNSYSPLLLDGGNLIRSRNTVILTERAVKENKTTKEELIPQLRQALQVEHVYLIPSQPYETSGHADGMIRLINDNTLLVADYHTESPSWRAKYERALNSTGLSMVSFPGVTTNIKNDKGEVAALGCYINFAWIGEVILFPQFDMPEDKEALKEAKRIFSGYKVLPVPAADMAMSCGVLNCATWNVQV